MFRIIHLSDIHFSFEKKKHYFDSMIESLIKDLSNLNNDKQIDFILITGDLLDKGGIGFDNINLAFQAFETDFINPITEGLNLDKSRVLFVPGNHDIDRKSIKPFSEVGIASTLINEKSVDDAIITDDPDLTLRLKSFKDFEKSYRKKYPSKKDKITNFQSTHIFEFDGKELGFACINSSWRCSGTETESIIIGSNQVISSINALKDCTQKILLSHYSSNSLKDFESNSFQERVLNEFDIACFGHQHQSIAHLISRGENSVFYSTIRGNLEYYEKNIDFIFGFAILDFKIDSPKKIIYSMKLYDKTNNNFYIYPKANNIEHVFPEGIVIENLISVEKIIDDIKTYHYSEIDSHLITFNTQTIAPKDFDSIFVDPILSKKLFYKKEDLDEKSDKEDVVSLSEILNTNNNIILIGMKESGKTMILDRLLKESINSYQIHKRLPIFIDFKDIKNNVNNPIAQFLKLSNSKSSEILKSENILLLVDNIEFEKTKNEVSKLPLFKFLREHKNVRLITTFNQDFEGEIPLDYVDHCQNNNFETFKIGSFKTKQVKELIQKWFNLTDTTVLLPLFSHISEAFKLFDIPRTPLSISLFLYLIEKQQNYKPKNMADMLENYIENLFQKTEKTYVFSDDWNYQDTIKMLSLIAKLMLEKEEENYSLQSHEILAFISNYLNTTGQTIFDEEKILGQLIDSGILIRRYSRIHFRFSCFFEFFLMKRMFFDSSFKEFVFREENYYKFVNEIDYFTALNEDSEILFTLNQRLMNAYSDFNLMIDEIGLEYDVIYKPITYFAKSLDDKKFSKNIEKLKNNKEEIDKIEDEINELKGLNTKIEKKQTLDQQNVRYLVRSLKVTSKVLKNTISANKELKKEVLESIVKCSLSFAMINQFMIIKEIENNIDNQNNNIKMLYILRHFMPYCIEGMLFDFLGTKRLNDVLFDRINEIFEIKEITEFEKFITLTLYFDIDGENCYNIVSNKILKFKKFIFYDSLFAKFMIHYLFRSHNKKTDSALLDLISIVINHSKGISKDKLNKTKNDVRIKALPKKREMMNQLFTDF